MLLWLAVLWHQFLRVTISGWYAYLLWWHKPFVHRGARWTFVHRVVLYDSIRYTTSFCTAFRQTVLFRRVSEGIKIMLFSFSLSLGLLGVLGRVSLSQGGGGYDSNKWAHCDLGDLYQRLYEAMEKSSNFVKHRLQPVKGLWLRFSATS